MPNIFKTQFRPGDWMFIIPVFFLAFGLSVWGFEICTSQACHAQNILDAVMRTLGILLKPTGEFVLGRDPIQLVIAQFLLPISALLGGAKILLQNIRHDVRLAMAKQSSGHVIVCGLGETGSQVIDNFLQARWAVVAVTKDATTFEAKSAEKRGVAVLEGDASQAALLNLAGLQRARALVITCGSDGTNLEIALRVRPLVDKERRLRDRLVIIPELRADWLYGAIVTHRGAMLESSHADIRPVHLNALSAKSLLSAPAFRLSGRLQEAEKRPRILLVGFNPLTTEIVSQLILNNYAAPGLKPAITILDSKPEAALDTLTARHPRLTDLCDVAAYPAAFSLEDADFWPDVDKAMAELAPAAVIVGLGDDDLTLRTAIELRARLDERGEILTPLFVQTRRQRELGEFLAALEIDRALGDRFTAFGDIAPLTTPASLLDPVGDALAKAAHEGHGDVAIPWDQLPEPVKQSNRAFADHLPIKMRALGLRLAPGAGGGSEPTEAEYETLAMMEHWRWRISRFAGGWREGPRRDVYRRQHPDLVSWDQLSPAARESNFDMARSIPKIAQTTGSRIVRDRIVPAADAASLSPRRDEQLIVVADPEDRGSLEAAVKAIDALGARVRLIWRGPLAWPPQGAGGLAPRIAEALEGWDLPPAAAAAEPVTLAANA